MHVTMSNLVCLRTIVVCAAVVFGYMVLLLILI